MWMWSTQAVPSMTSIPLYSQSSLKILPMSRFNLPYTTLLLFLGTHTIWYLHSHTVCANFFSSFAPFEFRSQNQHCFLNSKELFLKYYSIAFAILPSTAGGLALQSRSSGTILTRPWRSLKENYRRMVFSADWRPRGAMKNQANAAVENVERAKENREPSGWKAQDTPDTISILVMSWARALYRACFFR